MKPLHRLLIRQFKRNNLNLENSSESILALAEALSNSYEHYESSRLLVERAMEISNLELEEANIKLLEESETQKLLINNLKESIKDISIDEKIVEDVDLLQMSKILKTEIRNRKKLEKELKEAQNLAEESLKAKEIFLANMSHEIRTPLNAILGMTWLLSKTKLSEKQKKYKNVLRTSAENLLVIINNILDISKISSGKSIIEKNNFELDRLLKDLLRVNSFKAKEKGIELVLERDPDINKSLKGDSHKLNQILVNLLDNAIKFTSNGSVIVQVKLIEHKKDSDVIKFSVKDSGKGISEANLNEIFASFSQEDATITRKYGGSGLGLTISKELVSILGGKINVQSKENIGSIFSFIIEFQHCIHFKIAEKEKLIANKLEKNLEGISILIVEDEEYNMILLVSIFEKWNADIKMAKNGCEAIEKLKMETFDIVLMDMHMPQMDGIMATKEIRNTLNLDLPIIALTADVMDAEQKCIDAGMNDYISKPLNPDVLYDLIKKYC